MQEHTTDRSIELRSGMPLCGCLHIYEGVEYCCNLPWLHQMSQFSYHRCLFADGDTYFTWFSGEDIALAWDRMPEIEQELFWLDLGFDRIGDV